MHAVMHGCMHGTADQRNEQRLRTHRRGLGRNVRPGTGTQFEQEPSHLPLLHPRAWRRPFKLKGCPRSRRVNGLRMQRQASLQTPTDEGAPIPTPEFPHPKLHKTASQSHLLQMMATCASLFTYVTAVFTRLRMDSGDQRATTHSNLGGTAASEIRR